jgi:protein SCO1
MSGEAPASEGGPSTGRFGRLRFPFLWAFLLGIVVLTLIRPCLRRVPEPPPVQGMFPAVELVGAGSGIIRGVSLRGNVWVMSVEAQPCGAPCRERQGRMKELADAFTQFHLGGIRLLSLEVGPDIPVDPQPPLWLGARMSEDELDAFGGGARLGHLLIVDEAGGLRGWYQGDKDGFNEVYNRAQHVRNAGARH